MPRQTEEAFLASLDDLTGKVAIVTGGAGGIGVPTCYNLARRGCNVYIASRNEEAGARCIETLKKRLNASGSSSSIKAGELKFLKLDLGSMKSSRQAAEAFKKKEDKLDILVTSSGIVGVPKDELSPDGWEKTWAVNVLGHYVFVKSLLDLVERSSTAEYPARIVIVSSESSRTANIPEYEGLRKPEPGDKTRSGFLGRAMGRYGTSKLGNVWHARWLNDQMKSKDKNVLVNSCHPGTTSESSSMGVGILSPTMDQWVRWFINLFANSAADTAKTQTLLAAGTAVREKHVTGEYWVPVFSLFGYLGTYQESKNGKDRASKYMEDEKLEKQFRESVEKAEKEALEKDGILQE